MPTPTAISREALDRWELSLFQSEPFRSDQLRSGLEALLGATWPLRAARLLGEDGREREELHERLRALADGGEATPSAADALRRALVETLRTGDRRALVVSLDRVLLGLQPLAPVRLAAAG